MANPKFKLKLGTKVRDTVTGQEGIITVRAEHLNGCLRYTMECPNQGEKEVYFYYDEARLEKIEAKKVSVPQTGDGPSHDSPPS